jgi:hypothetical protein
MTTINRYPNVKSEVAMITPEQAEKYLGADSSHQRKISRPNLARLTNEMRSGRYQLNGESIVIGSSGRVLNGQHRLMACVNARTPFWTILVTGVEDEVFHSMDSGKRRSITDALYIRGEKNVFQLATTLVRLGEFLRDPALVGTEISFSNGELLDVLEGHPQVRDSVGWVGSNHRFRNLIAVSRIAWLHYVTTKYNPDASASFFTGLASGAMLAPTSPVYHLRARLLAEKSSERRLVVRHIMHLIIKAWNAHVKGQDMKVLSIKEGESFPVIVFSK